MSDQLDDPNAMTVEQACDVLCAHRHRDRNDWVLDVSLGEVVGGMAPSYRPPMPIHPVDAKYIAAFYWHKIKVPARDNPTADDRQE